MGRPERIVMMTSATQAIPERDEWSEFDSVTYCLGRPPVLGEVSSEEQPGPVSARLLTNTAANPPKKKRPLPRIWTPADEIAIMVPRSPMPVRPEEQATFASYGPDDFAAESRARSMARKKAVDKKRSKMALQFRAARRALTRGQTCPDCGVVLNPDGLFVHRPVFAVRDGASVLVCRQCNGGKEASPEAQALSSVASSNGKTPPAYLPSTTAIAAECEAIRSTWAPGEAERRREGIVN
jgi:hypothetical protein